MVCRFAVLTWALAALVPRMMGGEVAALNLTRAWSVAGPGRFDASGLVVRDARFFVVSDRHGGAVFALDFAQDEARAVPFATFPPPDPPPEHTHMDLEGLAAAPDGGFYLAPEWGFAVCHIPPGGGAARWVTPNVRAAGRAAGLFATRDAYVEGLAVLGSDHFVLACERQPRGLIEIRRGEDGWSILPQEMDTSRFEAPPGRSLDWSEVAVWRGRLFGLARNQHLVVELVREGSDSGRWTEGEAWSFAAVENAPEHRFPDARYGQAEGLSLTDEAIYVLIDNNDQPRAARAGDRRTWLFAFDNPFLRSASDGPRS